MWNLSIFFFFIFSKYIANRYINIGNGITLSNVNYEENSVISYINL